MLPSALYSSWVCPCSSCDLFVFRDEDGQPGVFKAMGLGERKLCSLLGLKRMERGELCPSGGGRAREPEARADPPLLVSTFSNEKW